MGNRLEVVALEKKYSRFEGKAEKRAREILKILKKDKVTAEIYLVGNRGIRRLNKKFRGKDKATNVLSFEEPKNFPHPETKENIRVIGGIFLNLEMCCRPATEKVDWDEVDRLLVHGLLHLFGHDHKKNNQAAKMERLEKKMVSLLKKI